MNVKPGDLAIVSWGPNMLTPEMVGMIVKVERIAINGERLNRGHIEIGSSLAWICSSPNGIPTRYSDGVLLMNKKRCIEDVLLRPVSGLPDEQHTKEHNELEA